MYIAKEGDRARAWHPDLQFVVEVTYQYRKIYLDAEDVEVYTLVGVHLETDTVLMIPHFPSSQDVAKAIREKQSKCTV